MKQDGTAPEKRRKLRPAQAKTITSLVLTLLLLGAGCAGASLAAVLYATPTAAALNVFTVGNVSAELTEPSWDSAASARTTYPGREISKDPTVTNNGSLPALLYLEVKTPMANVSTVTPGSSGNPDTINPPQLLPLFEYTADSVHWLLLESDIETTQAGDVYEVKLYGYYEVAAKDKVTEPLFEHVTFARVLQGELSMGEQLDMPVTAVAIQSDHVNPSGASFADQLRDAYAIAMN